jgi:hypothetical protein
VLAELRTLELLYTDPLSLIYGPLSLMNEPAEDMVPERCMRLGLNCMERCERMLPAEEEEAMEDMVRMEPASDLSSSILRPARLEELEEKSLEAKDFLDLNCCCGGRNCWCC